MPQRLAALYQRPLHQLMLPLFLIFLPMTAAPASGQPFRPKHTFFLKTRAGLSNYLGDNNTTLFNGDAFSVKGKWPYSFGFEVGYQFSDRWSTGLGMEMADYPIITRFYNNLNVENQPTTRRTFQLLFRYMLSERRVAPYLHFGYHLTFGDVTIFEITRLQNGTLLNTQSHYVHGPFLGLGLDYAVRPRFSLFFEATAHATLMDDSVDGRLPLGPPQPTNLHATNKFGTFDLLNAFTFGLLYRPWCGSACSDPGGTLRSTGMTQSPRRLGHSMIRVSKAVGAQLTSMSFYYAPRGLATVFLGIEGGLIPRSIYVRYSYPDGQESLDKTHFTGSFVGLSTQFYPLYPRSSVIQPHLGFTAAIPTQAHLTAGVDYRLGTSLALGVEGRYAYCPTQRQAFDKVIHYLMNRVCTYKTSVDITLSYSLDRKTKP